MSIQTTVAQYEQLKKEFAANNLGKCSELLGSLKVALVQLGFLTSTDTNVLLLTREILEFAVKWSVKAKDVSAFERYYSQLKAFYVDHSDKLPASQRMYPLVGLNLIRLLAQSRIAEFHTEIETLDLDVLLNNIYIRHPVQVEECLMEGSYNKIMLSRVNVPAEEYLFFMDMLVTTIQREIAACAEKAYSSIPIADAVTLLYFKTADELGWRVDLVTKRIFFPDAINNENEIPATKIIEQTLEYAKELERIV